VASRFSFATNALPQIVILPMRSKTIGRIYLGWKAVRCNSFWLGNLLSSNPVAIFAAVGWRTARKMPFRTSVLGLVIQDRQKPGDLP
jgi:hypothetical protein